MDNQPKVDFEERKKNKVKKPKKQSLEVERLSELLQSKNVVICALEKKLEEERKEHRKELGKHKRIAVRLLKNKQTPTYMKLVKMAAKLQERNELLKKEIDILYEEYEEMDKDKEMEMGDKKNETGDSKEQLELTHTNGTEDEVVFLCEIKN